MTKSPGAFKPQSTAVCTPNCGSHRLQLRGEKTMGKGCAEMNMKRGGSAGTTKFQVVPSFSDSVLKGSVNFELQQCDLLKVCTRQILATKVA